MVRTDGGRIGNDPDLLKQGQTDIARLKLLLQSESPRYASRGRRSPAAKSPGRIIYLLRHQSNMPPMRPPVSNAFFVQAVIKHLKLGLDRLQPGKLISLRHLFGK